MDQLYQIPVLTRVTRHLSLGDFLKLSETSTRFCSLLSLPVILQDLKPVDKNRFLVGTAQNGRLNLIRALVQSGADIHYNDDEAFRCAAQLGHLEIVKYLVGCGADIHARYDQALHRAVEQGHLDVVKYLVEHGVIISERDYGSLWWAKLCGHTKLFEYLQYQFESRIK